MASPVVEQVIENSTATAGTSHVINLPTATANQLLLIILDKGSTAATINAHASLTELLDENLANGLYIAYRWMDGTEPTSYTLTSSATTRSASFAYRISGAANPSANPPEIGTTGSGSSATPDPPASATPGSSKDYLFIAFYGGAGEEADDDTWSDLPPTNYAPSPPRQKACGIAGTNLGGMIAAAERQLTTGVAENPGTFTKDVSAAWRSQTIMVHPNANVSVTPSTASLTTALFAPTVTTTANQSVTPGTAALTTATFAPTVTATQNQIVTPTTASLTLTTFAPTVTGAAYVGDESHGGFLYPEQRRSSKQVEEARHPPARAAQAVEAVQEAVLASVALTQSKPETQAATDALQAQRRAEEQFIAAYMAVYPQLVEAQIREALMLEMQAREAEEEFAMALVIFGAL